MQYDILTVPFYVGIVLALLLALFLTSRRDSSAAAKTFAWGSVIAFCAGGTVFIHFWGWPSPGNYIGVMGGYLLMILAIIQYHYDRRNSVTS